MNPDLVFQALLRLCFDESPSKEDARLIDQGLVDDSLIQAHLRIMPMIYKRVPEDMFSPVSWQKIKGHYRYTLYRNQLLIHRASQFQEYLPDGPAILMKGLGLVIGVYNDLGERAMKDIDFLVPNLPADDQAILALLRSFNMKSNGDSYVATTWVDEQGFEYDLHRCLQAYEFGRRLVAVVERESLEYEIRQKKFHVLCPEHQFVLVLYHAGRSKFVRFSKRWVFDAFQILSCCDLDVEKLLNSVKLLSVPGLFKLALVELLSLQFAPPQVEKLKAIERAVPNKGRFLFWLRYQPAEYEGNKREVIKGRAWLKSMLDAYLITPIMLRHRISIFAYWKKVFKIGGYENAVSGLIARLRRRLTILFFTKA